MFTLGGMFLLDKMCVNLHVQVEDHDTPPEELHYLVIKKPNNGYLTLGERPEPVTSFTQYDVNHGRLHFTQQVKELIPFFFTNVCALGLSI